MKTLIKVTRKDIKKGTRRSQWRCPVVRAIDRRTNQQWQVIVAGTIDIGPHFLTMPDSVKRFVKAFDAGDRPRPFNFYLDIPRRYLKPSRP